MVYLLSLGDVEGVLWDWKSAEIAIIEKFFGACHQNEECNIRRPAQIVKKQILDFSENKSPIDLGKRRYIV